MEIYKLPLTLIRQEDGWWEARCPNIQGFRVEGETIGQVFDYLPDVLRTFYKVCQEKGWVFVANHPEARPENIVWVVEIPYIEKAA